jgi:tetratricopeptide (TPR) repeat protein
LKIDVTNNEYYYQRGIVNYKLNNNNESVEDLEMAIKNGFKDDIATLHYQLSLAYYNLNNFQRAIQAIDKAIKADESNYEYRELKFKIVIDRETLQLKTQISHLDHEVADKNKLIEALESKNKIQEQLYTATNISEAFAERAKRHKDVKEEFLML